MPDRDPFAQLPPLVGSESLTLVGGVVSGDGIDGLVDWLRGMGLARWWTFREWTDRMRLEEGLAGPADDLPRLVWGRWFGKVGDLEVRRDGTRFRWRWVGARDVRPPETVAPVEVDFFNPADGSTPRLRPRWGGRALLWDRADGRVATADGDTTLALLTDERRRLQYVTYDDHGIVAAVRYRSIEPVPAPRQSPPTADADAAMPHPHRAL